MSLDSLRTKFVGLLARENFNLPVRVVENLVQEVIKWQDEEKEFKRDPGTDGGTVVGKGLKKTHTMKINITGMGVDEVTVEMAKKIGAIRQNGWHYASSIVFEDQPRGKFVICVFCK